MLDFCLIKKRIKTIKNRIIKRNRLGWEKGRTFKRLKTKMTKLKKIMAIVLANG
jgi:hypothetical protein